MAFNSSNYILNGRFHGAKWYSNDYIQLADDCIITQFIKFFRKTCNDKYRSTYYNTLGDGDIVLVRVGGQFDPTKMFFINELNNCNISFGFDDIKIGCYRITLQFNLDRTLTRFPVEKDIDIYDKPWKTPTSIRHLEVEFNSLNYLLVNDVIATFNHFLIQQSQKQNKKSSLTKFFELFGFGSSTDEPNQNIAQVQVQNTDNKNNEQIQIQNIEQANIHNNNARKK